ncbi:recombinase family protein [uncultured Pontibacter sp.]|uniref:recombinase family protein n=1 Tax=uncultured Pontibacter sp. TaxID=453356 RepID=UPI003447C700
MSKQALFQQFAKTGKDTSKAESKKAVIYTRVSTKNQAEHNQSLPFQKKACTDFANKQGYEIVEFFGGTHESAKNDERKEFNRMLNFVRRKDSDIGHIIVYSFDRFSRSGLNAATIKKDLEKEGVHVCSVTQHVDSKTPSGVFTQNMMLLVGELDNDQRREKTMAGSIERLRQGHATFKAPMGFDQKTENGEQKITVNATGKLIQKAFKMKANEGLSNEQILERLRMMGLRIRKQMLTAIFKNPFYCGKIVNKLIPGEVVNGRQEKLISEDIFLKVNQIQARNNHGYKHKAIDDTLPLKRFVYCSKCGTLMTGYEVKRKKLFYYKCNKKGCGSNKSAQHMHAQFNSFLKTYDLAPDYIAPLKHQLAVTFNELTKQQAEVKQDYRATIKAIEDKLEKAAENLIDGNIKKAMYDKLVTRLEAELHAIKEEKRKATLELSNLEKFVDFGTSILVNISESWGLGNTNEKHRIQKLLFPNGISYNTETGHYRTKRTNTILNLIHTMSSTYSTKNKRPISVSTNRSVLVAGTGLEPVTFGL